MNKKLIKTIASITCGLGIVASIPFMVTNCACSQEKIKPLPEDVYDIDENNTLLGFTDEFLTNPTAYDMYNTMEIPARVTSITDQAFFDTEDKIDSTIPSFITKLTFFEESKCTSIGFEAFNSFSSLTSVAFPSELSFISNDTFAECSALTSVSFPGSLTRIDENAFGSCISLTEIIWNDLNSAPRIVGSVFRNVANTGHVKSTGSYTSSQLLLLLKEKGGLPSGWKIAED